jgi:hypothetical protein
VRYGRVVALLSQSIRRVAITGRVDAANAWFAGRQGGRWAEQAIGAAFPWAAPAAGTRPPVRREPARSDPAETLRELTELHRRGVLTDAELDRAKTWVSGAAP